MNKSVINEVRANRIQLLDATNPLLAVKYKLPRPAGEQPDDQARNCTVVVDNNGGGSSKLRVTVAVQRVDEDGTAATDDTYIYDGVTGGGGTVTAVTETLGELVYELNQIPGITAVRMDGPADYSLATDDFIDVTVKDITPDLMNLLFKDADQVLTSCVRIGVPERRDTGRMKILRISGSCTGVTTAPVIKLIRDKDPLDLKMGVADEEILAQWVLAEAQTEYIDHDELRAMTVRGPIMVEVVSSDLSVCDIQVLTQTAEY